MQLRMHFRSAVSSAQLGALVTEVIKHVLYDRERLPMPFEQFKRFLRNTWSGNLQSTNVKVRVGCSFDYPCRDVVNHFIENVPSTP